MKCHIEMDSGSETKDSHWDARSKCKTTAFGPSWQGGSMVIESGEDRRPHRSPLILIYVTASDNAHENFVAPRILNRCLGTPHYPALRRVQMIFAS